MKAYRSAAVTLVLLLGASVSAQQLRRVDGVVVLAATGQPVEGARVTLQPEWDMFPPTSQVMLGGTTMQPVRRPATGNGPSVTTDSSGRFTLQGLATNRYRLVVERNGYLATEAYFSVSADELRPAVSIGLTPLATVRGRIHDGADRPLVNVPVQLLRSSYAADGQHIYVSSGIARTNDRGEYRLYWVTPGRYYLLAGQPRTSSDALDAMRLAQMSFLTASGTAIPPVLGYAYYPGVTDFEGAQAIDLRPGSDIRMDLNISPQPRAFTIRGKVVDSKTGQPPPRASVAASTGLPGSRTNVECSGCLAGSYNRADGSFMIPHMLPGTYTLTAMVDDESMGQLTVSVSTSDAVDIVIPVSARGSISGQLRFEGQPPVNTAINMFQVVVAAVAADGRPVQASRDSVVRRTQVNADGTFRLNNVIPGDHRLEITANQVRLPLVGDAYLREARFDGADVLSQPLHFTGASQTGLELIIASGTGKIDGAVLDSRAEPLARARVVLIPARVLHRPDLYREVITDTNGRFFLSSVPPGEYRIAAWEQIEQYAWFDPAVQARAGTRAQVVHVVAGSTETVTLTAIAEVSP